MIGSDAQATGVLDSMGSMKKEHSPDNSEHHVGLGQALRSRHHWAKIAVRLVVLLVIAGLLYLAGHYLGGYVPDAERWVEGLGWIAPLVFFGAFVVLTTLFVPKTLMSIAGGTIFGLGWGYLYVIISSVIGSVVIFFIARKLLRKPLQRKLAGHPKLRVVEQAASESGFKLAVLLRMTPFNYTVLSYMLGASEIRFGSYLLAMIGILPGTFMTVYFGFVAQHVVRKGGHSDNLSMTHEIVMVCGLVVTVVAMSFIAHIAHNALKRASEQIESRDREST